MFVVLGRSVRARRGVNGKASSGLLRGGGAGHKETEQDLLFTHGSGGGGAASEADSRSRGQDACGRGSVSSGAGGRAIEVKAALGCLGRWEWRGVCARERPRSEAQ